MKKLFSAFLLLSAFFILIACATEEEGVIPEFVYGDSLTYNGLTLNFYMPEDICYERDSLFGDIVRKRVAEIEEKFDINIVFNDEDVSSKLSYWISAGISTCDVVLSDSYSMYDEMKAGFFIPIDELDSNLSYLDGEKWGSRSQLVSFVHNEHLYGVLPMLWPGTVYKQCDHFFFVNEDIVRGIGQPDPREFVEDGTWTRNKYEEILDIYTHTDNNGNLIYALAAKPGHYFSIAIKASGIDYIIDNGDGTFTNAFTTNNAVDKLTWISETFWSNYNKTIVEGTDTFTTIAKFVNGETAMVLTHLYFGLRDIEYTVENFGLLPFPLSDDLQGTGWISQHEFFNNAIFFPINSEEQTASSNVINELFNALPGYETDEERYDYYDRYIFHDSRDTKLIFEALQNCRYLPFNDNGYLIPNAMTTAAGSKSISQILDENKDIMQNMIDTVCIPRELACDALWGD